MTVSLPRATWFCLSAASFTCNHCSVSLNPRTSLYPAPRPSPPTSQEDVVGVGGVSVAGLDKVSHLLAHARVAARVGVRAHTAERLVQLAGALNRVLTIGRAYG